MKNYTCFFIVVAVLLYSCNDSEQQPSPPAPKLLASSPANNAENIPAGDLTVTLTFDQNVICPAAEQPKITISNGAQITQIAYNSGAPTAQIFVSGLDFNQNYTLNIPANVIQTPAKTGAEAISLNFKTKEQVVISGLVTEHPSPEAVALFDYLRQIYGHKILSATVATVNWNTNEAQWVFEHTGKYPAINVFDYIHLYASPANWIDYGDISVVENWHNAGGIVGTMWHWNVPKSETAAAGEVTYRPEETTFRTSNSTVSGTWENTVVNADLEKIANYLLLLKNKNIPVIWRPLHEAAGNIYAYPASGAWFWWGNDGAEAYKNLWKYMFNYLKNKGLNNLIWVFTTQTDNATSASDLPFYPGDEYVDIVGRDSYNNQNPASLFAEFSVMEQNFSQKMLTLAECGNIAPISDQLNAGAKWLWFMPWYDYARTNNPASAAFQETSHEHCDVNYWNAAWADERVLSRDKINY
ncbi:MAG: Ig-like domain-containing protein [Tannerella sp.]|jgi:mannan endo-1,4-beta-mannosidase|nr:Ig-like domain-containing protein [Tannerella sp.]